MGEEENKQSALNFCVIVNNNKLLHTAKTFSGFLCHGLRYATRLLAVNWELGSDLLLTGCGFPAVKPDE